MSPIGGRARIEAMLPHRDPLLLVDTLDSFTPGPRGSLAASFSITGDEAWLRGHFPGRPLWPGVLLIEGLAQCAGLLIHMAAAHARGEASPRPVDAARLGMLAAADVKLLRIVEPPAQIRYRVRIVGVFGGLHRVAGEAAVGDRAVADGSVSIALASDGAGPG